MREVIFPDGVFTAEACECVLAFLRTFPAAEVEQDVAVTFDGFRIGFKSFPVPAERGGDASGLLYPYQLGLKSMRSGAVPMLVTQAEAERPVRCDRMTVPNDLPDMDDGL